LLYNYPYPTRFAFIPKNLAPLREGLRLAVDEVIHDDDIQIGYFQDAIARGNSD